VTIRFRSPTLTLPQIWRRSCRKPERLRHPIHVREDARHVHRRDDLKGRAVVIVGKAWLPCPAAIMGIELLSPTREKVTSDRSAFWVGPFEPLLCSTTRRPLHRGKLGVSC
jgi:hypothetical protein